MKRTTLRPDLTKVRPVAGSATGMIRCGFCQSGNHDRCPGGVEHRGGLIWKCGCAEHPPVLRCVDCGNTNPQEVDSQRYRCLDKQDCKDRATHRTDNNPVVVKIREIKQMSETETTEKPARQPRAPKVGYCVHCNEPTKGGKFVAGHDARWISELVKAVMGGHTTEKAARAKISQVASDALVTKFDKSLASQRGKAERAKLAKEERAVEEAAAAEAAALEELEEAAEDLAEDLEDDEPEDDEDIEDEDDEDDEEPAPAPAPRARRTLKKAAPAEAPAKPAVRRRAAK